MFIIFPIITYKKPNHLLVLENKNTCTSRNTLQVLHIATSYCKKTLTTLLPIMKQGSYNFFTISYCKPPPQQKGINDFLDISLGR
ncbi:hypothetical protein G293_03085 [Candidatus Liberibacter africanus PTSAPSY]|uniref:Uncharacterized protein n=1 Tax=Candidatus Liberibacter africanus PTSAPSY TaxID=1277257 RepID=A0A0G3I4R1_LIBAF|nr:hypothetical protein G293_03085 [Candidatus Liberibacter africanus PTSAPSY]